MGQTSVSFFPCASAALTSGSDSPLVEGAPGHALVVGLALLPEELEGEEHLGDGDARANQAAEDVLVATGWRQLHRVAAVVAGEVEEHQVRLVGEDVAVEAKHRQHRAGAADGGVMEREMRLRVFFGQVARHQPAKAGDVRLGGVGAPSERAAKEDDAQLFPRFGAAVEFRERGLAPLARGEKSRKGRGQRHAPAPPSASFAHRRPPFVVVESVCKRALARAWGNPQALVMLRGARPKRKGATGGPDLRRARVWGGGRESEGRRAGAVVFAALRPIIWGMPDFTPNQGEPHD